MRKFIAPLGLLLFFILTSCGGIDTVFSTSGTYRLDVLVNESSLEECSIIGGDNQIRPYFINFVSTDPDIRGLTVFLQTPGGRAVSGKLQYTLTREGEESPLLETPKPETPGTKGAETKETPKIRAQVGLADDTGAVDPKGSLPKEKDGKAAEDTELTAEEEKEGKEEAEGIEKETETKETKIKDGIAEDEPAVKKESFFRMGSADRLIPVARLDVDLPLFVLPEDLEIGRYVLVFQIQGEREILSRIDKPFFFTADADLAIKDIKKYLPGYSAGSPLIPPGTSVMLEAQIAADKRLDPYVVWYSGRKRIGEGRLSEGGNRIMWKAPEHNGFHYVRAELLPFPPAQNLSGKSKELSLPVSSKREEIGYFSETGESFSYWYQFGGDLLDSKAAGTEKALVAEKDAVPRWLPDADIYGIVLGTEDVYTLPRSSFTISAEEQGSGQFMFRFKPLGGGTIFKAAFKTDDSFRDALNLILSYTGDTLKLSLAAGTVTQSAEFSSELFNKKDFVPVLVNFSIRGTVFSAHLELEDSGITTEEKSITLSECITGMGTVQFGALPAKNAVSSSPARESQKTASPAVTVILDEAAFKYKVEPLEVQPLPDETEDIAEGEDPPPQETEISEPA